MNSKITKELDKTYRTMERTSIQDLPILHDVKLKMDILQKRGMSILIVRFKSLDKVFKINKPASNNKRWDTVVEGDTINTMKKINIYSRSSLVFLSKEEEEYDLFEKIFHKKDLKDGMVLELKSGNKYLFANKVFISKDLLPIPSESFDDNMILKNGENQVEKIYYSEREAIKIEHLFNAGFVLDKINKALEVIWEKQINYSSCPFCGNKDISTVAGKNFIDSKIMNGKYITICSLPEGCGATSGKASSRKQSILNWNTRSNGK